MINLFNNIGQGNKVKLLKLLEANIFTYQENVYINNLVKDNNFIAIILTGDIDIIKINYDGQETIIDTLTKDEVFGNIITNINSENYEILTKSRTKLIIIDYDTIINYEETKYQYYNEFIKNLLLLYNEKIIANNERISILSEKTIRNRLLEYFRITSLKNNSKNIYVPSTYIKLADYLGVDRSAMARELKYLKEEGFIKIQNKKPHPNIRDEVQSRYHPN